MTPIPVLLADDQAMIRLGLRMILDHEPDLAVVAEAADGEQAVTLAREHRPAVVLMDIRMPGLDGIEATRRLRADPGLADARVLVLTTFDDEEYVTSALRAGADGFLLKDTDPATLVDAVRRVHGGGSVLDPAVAPLVLDQWRRWGRTRPDAGPTPGALDGLSARERDVLLAVARGRSNQEAADALGLAVATVKAHVHALLAKTGCASRTQLVVLAYEAGLVVPGSAGPGTTS
ncbi:DNA-binding response regulator [Cellulomonas hominis]|uniref:DNA-binding NarL/FixJ family response regulator n=1 Tax=Cellulomonas hominis TaxID=156981 RepID=A0A511FE95_9CELL|nr:response regulator transcription factor [Cellulomonas hominis]MBB5474497.1 DNA-binding NarL/FixJ family response regulator [Cellulomonas hominis]GEL47565.1 DNA-binding response regulator [Cellulomonas hominis]